MHDRFNGMLTKAESMLKEIGVPISQSICPNIVFIRTYSWYGQCCSKASKYNNTDYDFVIRISTYTLQNTEKSLMNTMLHELIHTIEGTKGHDLTWKKWAQFAGEKLGYDIKRNNGDKTTADRESMNSHIHRRFLRDIIIQCESCDYRWYRHRKTKMIKNINRYNCPFCHTKTLYVWEP